MIFKANLNAKNGFVWRKKNKTTKNHDNNLHGSWIYFEADVYTRHEYLVQRTESSTPVNVIERIAQAGVGCSQKPLLAVRNMASVTRLLRFVWKRFRSLILVAFSKIKITLHLDSSNEGSNFVLWSQTFKFIQICPFHIFNSIQIFFN